MLATSYTKPSTQARFAIVTVSALFVLVACATDATTQPAAFAAGPSAEAPMAPPTPPPAPPPPASVAAAPAPAATGDIVAVASGNSAFSTLVAAVGAAGLAETLQGPGPFTVFAPTNEAFAKLPAGTVENLLKPENKAQLVALLTYHVVPGKVMAASLSGKTTTVATAQGGNVSINGMDGVSVNGAKVVIADVPASNGVIHAIDTVIMPPN